MSAMYERAGSTVRPMGAGTTPALAMCAAAVSPSTSLENVAVRSRRRRPSASATIGRAATTGPRAAASMATSIGALVRRGSTVDGSPSGMPLGERFWNDGERSRTSRRPPWRSRVTTASATLLPSFATALGGNRAASTYQKNSRSSSRVGNARRVWSLVR